MMIRKIALIATSAILSLTTASAFANLVLSNQTRSIPVITAKCTGQDGVPLFKGMTVPIEWSDVRNFLGGVSGSCTFKAGSKVVGDASLVLNDASSPTAASITALNIYAGNIKIKIEPDTSIPSGMISTIKVTVYGG